MSGGRCLGGILLRNRCGYAKLACVVAPSVRLSARVWSPLVESLAVRSCALIFKSFWDISESRQELSHEKRDNSASVRKHSY
jgi:hypothetical protein